VPIRVEIGPRDIAKKQAIIVRRDTGGKEIVPLASLEKHISKSLDDMQASLFQRARQFQESSIVERNGRYCVPVRTDRRTQVPGLVLDRSGSGATVFVEPFDAVPLNNDFVEADRDYTQAVQAYLRELLAELRAHREDFERWRSFQSDVDETLALLRWARLCEGHLPFLGDGDLVLQDARHPLLISAVRDALALEPLDHPVIPLSLQQTADQPGMVISGSNTGGKTVVLKTIGLLWSLAASGLAVPAREGSRFPELKTLHADIGDHQTLLGSLSTFSSHIVHLRAILTHAKPGGLVLLDELGTGTDPKEGAALGIALLEALSRRGCWVLCSTHLGEISQWALGSKRFQNASVQFDEAKLEPTYRLMVGLPGQSRALTIARRLGLQPPVLDRAEQVLGRREQDWL
jgi:DNA mismatch repair protein MutS2